jgi:hypothetical protein
MAGTRTSFNLPRVSVREPNQRRELIGMHPYEPSDRLLAWRRALSLDGTCVAYAGAGFSDGVELPRVGL